MGLIARLLASASCAALPPAFALVYVQQEAARDGRERSGREALAQAELVAAEVDGLLDAARRFMHGEARGEPAGAKGCGEVLARSASGPGRYAFLVVLDGGGRPACVGLPDAAGAVRDAAPDEVFGTVFGGTAGATAGAAAGVAAEAIRHAAAEAVLRRGFAVGRFGRAEGEVGPFLPLASPSAGPRDEPGGAPTDAPTGASVLVLGLNLDRLGERMAALPRPFGGAAWVADRDGTVLARTPDARFRPGQALGPAWAGLLRSAGPGTASAPDEAAGGRLVGYVPPGEASAGLFVAAEAPSGGLGPSAWRGVALAASSAFLGLALAAWAAHRLIRAPVMALLSAARRRAGGDPAARARPRAGPDTELGQLARAFDALADTEDELRAELRRLTAASDARVEERTRALREANRRLRAQLGERETAASALSQTQTLRAVGQLAGGVAHEFNNLLAGVLGSLELLSRRTPIEARDHRRLIGMALDAVQHGGRLTTQLLSFSRGQRLDPRALDPNAAIRGMAGSLTAALGADVRLEVRLEPRPWPVWVDRDGFEAAILNLALNGRDAMPGGGRLLIVTANRTVGPNDATGDLRPGDYVVVVVADSGTGMTLETVSRAFEPFFTTKPPGKGAGLGLSQVHGLARQSGGDVRLSSRPGRGTRVTLLLPRAPADAGDAERRGAVSADEPLSRFIPTGRDERRRAFIGEAGPADTPADTPADAAAEDRGGARVPAPVQASPAPECPGDAGAVLLVDDDDAVRDVTAMLLSEAGHRVHRAAGAEEALRLLAEHGDAVHVLITDYAMPGMNGLELIALVRRSWPGVAALLATGCAEPPGLRDQGPAGPDGIVRKPYRGRELLARVRRAMQDRRVPDSGVI